jgi:protein phosphatase
MIAPRLWFDTQPASAPPTPTQLPDAVLPYLRLHPYRLHLPTPFGFCSLEDADAAEVLLLENIPVDRKGQWFPAIAQGWQGATAVRQVYWLWQLLELWTPLVEAGVASSLLKSENIRVEGWRVRLQELIADDPATAPSLAQLATTWHWLPESHPQSVDRLQQLAEQMQQATDESAEAIATAFNQLLLEQAVQLPLKLTVAGATTTGPQRNHNEDACYPMTIGTEPPLNDPLVPNLAIVCDGIGGHAGGEVASQLAMRSLQLQVLAMLGEIAEEPEITPPHVVAQQLEAIVRVANNLIAEQNNLQGREARQRMGTTLVMALQLPQSISPTAQTLDQIDQSQGMGNSHELYLVHVGDSRAYWLTPHYCHLLTVDDDVAAREVRLKRNLHQIALRRSDAGALTQALGTRDGELLHPTVQRFILEENGLLLLCSDGLSDGDRIERHWETMTNLVLRQNTPLEAAVQYWIDLANSKNGHDNTSVVLLHCQVSTEPTPLDSAYPELIQLDPVESELSDSARALLYDQPNPVSPAAVEEPSLPVSTDPPASINLWAVLSLAAFMFLTGAAAIAVWRQLDPVGFQETFEWLQPEEQEPFSN